MSRVFALGSLLALAAALVGGCVDRRPVGDLRNGPAECAEMAVVCKAPAEAYGGQYQDCYDTGKSKVSNACINYYYSCIDQCHAANDALGMGGQGGAAGDEGIAGAGGG